MELLECIDIYFNEPRYEFIDSAVVFYYGANKEIVNISRKDSQSIMNQLICDFHLQECSFHDLDEESKHLITFNSGAVLDITNSEIPDYVHIFKVPYTDTSKYFFEYMYRRYRGTEMELYFCWNSKKECFASNSELLALRALLMYGVNENIVYAAQTFEKLQRHIELYQDLLFDVYTKCKKK